MAVGAARCRPTAEYRADEMAVDYNCSPLSKKTAEQVGQNVGIVLSALFEVVQRGDVDCVKESVNLLETLAHDRKYVQGRYSEAVCLLSKALCLRTIQSKCSSTWPELKSSPRPHCVQMISFRFPSRERSSPLSSSIFTSLSLHPPTFTFFPAIIPQQYPL